MAPLKYILSLYYPYFVEVSVIPLFTLIHSLHLKMDNIRIKYLNYKVKYLSSGLSTYFSRSLNKS